MSHVTFYRKYRSRTFDELIGQEHIVQTLKNAISHDRLAHAYLFSGPRGTGKTSTALILAKSLNCETSKKNTPCLVCSLCKKINNGHCADIIEIDAASNTGVDNIRDLNEQINFYPIEARYKIYIIDEVHMLSSGAFNALLKTLEEPPKNTLFVLATTEAQKIPVTIHSRCQSLQFRRLNPSEITRHLQYVAKEESVTLSEPAAQLMARNVEGCMRDALSLLDQIHAFQGGAISAKDVALMIGGISTDALLSFADSFLKGEREETLSKLRQFFQDGCQATQLCSDFSTLFQTLIFFAMGVKTDWDTDISFNAQYKKLSSLSPIDTLIACMSNFAKLQMEIKRFPNPESLLIVSVLNQFNKISPKITDSRQPVTPTSHVSQTTPPTVKINSFINKPIQKKEALPQMPNPISTSIDKKTPRQKINPITPIPLSQNTGLDSSLSQAIWEKVIKTVQKERPALYTMIADSCVISSSSEKTCIKLTQNFKFFTEKLSEPKQQTYLKGCLKPYLCTDTTLHFEINSTQIQAGENNSEGGSSESSKLGEKKASSYKINQLIDLFEGVLQE